VLRLLWLVERMLDLGLKNVAFFGSTTPWHYLQHVAHCLPGTDAFVTQVKELATTDWGRGRIAIRIALNEASLVEYLRCVCVCSEFDGDFVAVVRSVH
jgi:hypothetical protein